MHSHSVASKTSLPGLTISDLRWLAVFRRMERFIRRVNVCRARHPKFASHRIYVFRGLSKCRDLNYRHIFPACWQILSSLHFDMKIISGYVRNIFTSFQALVVFFYLCSIDARCKYLKDEVIIEVGRFSFIY